MYQDLWQTLSMNYMSIVMFDYFCTIWELSGGMQLDLRHKRTPIQVDKEMLRISKHIWFCQSLVFV